MEPHLRRVLVFAIFATLLSSTWNSHLEAQGAVRLGHVDTSVILTQAPGAPEADAELARLAERADAEVAEMQAELDNLVATYERDRATLLPNIQQARETEITQRQARHQERFDQMSQELQQLRVTLFAPIVSQMTAAIEAIREEGGYHLIFEMAGSDMTAADPSLDITAEVLARMQEAAAIP